ncbi:MAG: hypothetical protein GY938_32085, partial [Ketobacter sp.]|nr:hypothetical protein [Ketobacter sp.]
FMTERSGSAKKYGIITAGNIIDPNYRKGIHVTLVNTGSETFYVRREIACAQIIFLPFCENIILEEYYEDFEETERGNRRFGSSDMIGMYCIHYTKIIQYIHTQQTMKRGISVLHKQKNNDYNSSFNCIVFVLKYSINSIRNKSLHSQFYSNKNTGNKTTKSKKQNPQIHRKTMKNQNKSYGIGNYFNH